MSTPSPVTGFVLAGGESSRMGRDKAALKWKGQSLLHQMTGLLKAVCDSVHVVGRADLPDHHPGLGPIGGIATALHATTTAHNLVVAVDLPLLTMDFLKYFTVRYTQSNRHLCACKIESGFPLCLGIDQSLTPSIDDYLKGRERSVHGFMRETAGEIITAAELIEAGFSTEMFFNLNTEADYQQLNRDNS